VQAARARARVSQEAVQRVAAMVGYTRLLAPYEGIVVDRNANTGDYVQPGTGDLTSGRGKPVYVVARTDTVRVYVDVPELDANSVQRGTKATVRIQALDYDVIDASVTRTSWALRPRSRTLRAEIDLPNPDARLLPAMYAYAKVRIEHSSVKAVPLAAVVEIGNQNYCFLYEKGKAIQTAVQTGINDGKWIEVIRKKADGNWVAFNGDEEVILGELAEISNGQAVQVSQGKQN
jgi:HlyD family secretion protein